MTKKYWLFVIIVSAVPPLCAYGSYLLGHQDGYYEKEMELKECAIEVSRTCPKLTNYAIALEEENAKLNKRPRKCP